MNQLSQVIRSISTDELAVSAHVDKAKEIGQIFIGSMMGKVVTEVPLKKKDQVKTMTLTNKIKKVKILYLSILFAVPRTWGNQLYKVARIYFLL